MQKYMAHGKYCHCMMCTVGKKMGMIHDERHDGDHEHDHDGKDHGEDEKEGVCMACSCPCDDHQKHTCS